MQGCIRSACPRIQLVSLLFSRVSVCMHVRFPQSRKNEERFAGILLLNIALSLLSFSQSLTLPSATHESRETMAHLHRCLGRKDSRGRPLLRLFSLMASTLVTDNRERERERTLLHWCLPLVSLREAAASSSSSLHARDDAHPQPSESGARLHACLRRRERRVAHVHVCVCV